MHLDRFDALVRTQTEQAAAYLHRMHAQYIEDGRALDVRLQQDVRELLVRCQQDYHDRLARLDDGRPFERVLRSENSWEVACRGVDDPVEA